MKFFLFILYLLKDLYNTKEIYCIDVGLNKHYSLGSMSKEEIIKIESITHELTNTNIENYINEWEKLKNENTDLRLIIDGVLKSCNYNYLDEIILSLLAKYNDIELYDFIGKELLTKKIAGIYGSAIFEFRIKEMIKNGAILIDTKENKHIKVNEKNV